MMKKPGFLCFVILLLAYSLSVQAQAPVDVMFRRGVPDENAALPPAFAPVTDVVPDAFDFVDQAGLAVATPIESNIVRIDGFETEIQITTPVGLEIRKTDAVGSIGTYGTSLEVVAGDFLQIRASSPAALSETASFTLSIGGITDTWSLSTLAIDDTPNAFSFNDSICPYPLAVLESNTVTITGINISPTATASNGALLRADATNIGAASWGSNISVSNHDQLQAQMICPASFNTTVTTTVSVASQSANWNLTLPAQDNTPDVFAFTNSSNLEPATQTDSVIVQITGFNTLETITPNVTSGGGTNPQIRVTNAAGTTGTWGASASVKPGDYVQLRAISDPAFANLTAVAVTVGSVTANWTLETRPRDTTPDSYSYVPQTATQLSETRVSNVGPALSGFDSPVTIFATSSDGQGNPQLSLDNVTYSSSLSVSTGDQIYVRLDAPATVSTARTLSLRSVSTSGTVFATYQVTAPSSDVIADAFAFADSNALSLNQTVTVASTQPVSGFAGSLQGNIQFSGAANGFASPLIATASSAVGCNSASFTGSVVTGVTPGQFLCARVSTPNTASVTATLEIRLSQNGTGGTAASWNVGTESPDTTPNSFTIPDSLSPTAGATVYSSAILIQGINAPATRAVSIATAGPTAPAHAASADAVCDASDSYGTGTTISNGQYLCLRATSPASLGTGGSINVTVGSYSTTWRIDNVAVDTTPNSFTIANSTTALPNTQVYATGVQITGINSPATRSLSLSSGTISGLAHKISASTTCDASGTWTNAGTNATVNNGDYICLRGNSPTSFGSSGVAQITIGGVSANWQLSTDAQDTTPNAFTYATLTAQSFAANVTSSAPQINSINGSVSFSATVTSGNGTNPRVAASADANCSNDTYSSSSTLITNGQYACLQITTPSVANNTTIVTATIGTVTATWSVTTATSNCGGAGGTVSGNSCIFSTPGSYTFISPVANINVAAWGGGGGSGFRSNGGNAGHGGGSGYVSANAIAAGSGSTLQIVVGSGGAGGNFSSQTSSTGGGASRVWRSSGTATLYAIAGGGGGGGRGGDSYTCTGTFNPKGGDGGVGGGANGGQPQYGDFNVYGGNGNLGGASGCSGALCISSGQSGSNAAGTPTGSSGGTGGTNASGGGNGGEGYGGGGGGNVSYSITGGTCGSRGAYGTGGGGGSSYIVSGGTSSFGSGRNPADAINNSGAGVGGDGAIAAGANGNAGTAGRVVISW